MTGSHEVRGSIPLSSTNENKRLRRKLKTSFLFLALLSRICPAFFIYGIPSKSKKHRIPVTGKKAFFSANALCAY